jgi:hypothetical protein
MTNEKEGRTLGKAKVRVEIGGQRSGMCAGPGKLFSERVRGESKESKSAVAAPLILSKLMAPWLPGVCVNSAAAFFHRSGCLEKWQPRRPNLKRRFSRPLIVTPFATLSRYYISRA